MDLPDGLIEAYIGDLPAIDQYVAQRGELDMQDVPVRFTLFQGPNGWNNISQAGFDAAVSLLNTAFQPAGLNFVQCGPVNEVWDDRMKTGGPNPGNAPDQFYPLFSYTSGAMEVFLTFDPGVPTAALPLPAYQSGNPNWMPPYQEHRNWVKMKGGFGSDFVHEVGHHFGLLHTHFLNNSYHVPYIGENTKDYPYPVYIPGTTPPEMQPWWWGRELVIRNDDGSKTFAQANWNEAGDLVKDTPADCGAGSPNYFPGCPLDAQNIFTCQFNSTLLTYKDYNGDAIYPPPAGYSLGKNYMSYWTACQSEFTQMQYNRIGYYYETIRKPEYAFDKCGNFADKVEFEGGSEGLHNVTIRVRHPFDSRKCNVTTNREGEFGGILHLDDLKAYVYHNGRKGTLAYAGDPLRTHYDHTKCEWLRGVSTFDLLQIQRHILGLVPFTSGYAKIAADASKSNSVTTFDIVELRKLLLGIYDKLPAHDQPWRFVPEFISQDYATDFNFNPFNVTVGGGAAYLEQGWQFSLPDAYNGKKGFDGIKIGDVNSSWLTTTECPNETETTDDEGEKPVLTVPPAALTQNQVVALTFKANHFQQVEAFQLGIRLPYEYFELMDVTNATLPAYTEDDYFGLAKLEENAVRTLWFEENGGTHTLQNNSTLFSLVVRAKQPVANLQSLLKLDNSILPNQFWRAASVNAEAVSLTIIVEDAPGDRTDGGAASSHAQAREQVLQCYPNPFKNNIQLTFAHKGQAEQSDLKVTSAQGMEVHHQAFSLLSGENTLEINALKDAPTGVYWITLTAQGKTHSTTVVKE